MKISGYPTTNILLLVIYCLWCQVQPTAGYSPRSSRSSVLLSSTTTTTSQPSSINATIVTQASHVPSYRTQFRNKYMLQREEEKARLTADEEAKRIAASESIQNNKKAQCSGEYGNLACAMGNGKRSDVDDVAQVIDLRGVGEPDIDYGSGAEKTGGEGGRRSGEFPGIRVGDDLRSELNDRGQLLEERQLLNIGNRRLPRPRPRPAPLDSVLGRLRPLLRATKLDDDKGVEEQREEEGPPRRISTDINGRYINRANLEMLRRILDDIALELDSQRSPDSLRKEQG